MWKTFQQGVEKSDRAFSCDFVTNDVASQMMLTLGQMMLLTQMMLNQLTIYEKALYHKVFF